MEIVDYIFGKQGLMILGLVIVIAVLYKKYRNNRDFRRPSDKKKKKS